jgi:ribosomal protein S18 acetylase RimI-like enzyme
MGHLSIRLATLSELPVLMKIEMAAGILFRGTGLIPSEETDPGFITTLEKGYVAGLCWVAEAPDPQDATHTELAGFVVCREEGRDLYLDQISVHPDFMRQGIGAALTKAVFDSASKRGLARVTLSTFRDVSWNGPYYARLGFRELPHDDLLPWMLTVRDKEACDLDITKRCFMACPVGEERV